MRNPINWQYIKEDVLTGAIVGAIMAALFLLFIPCPAQAHSGHGNAAQQHAHASSDKAQHVKKSGKRQGKRGARS